jgi:glucosamine-6-phosphate deaminase
MPRPVKRKLQWSRRQQVDEGWFDTLDDVPEQALSMTIPSIMQGQTISCVVSDERKSESCL